MLETLVTRISAHPKRWLGGVLVFVILAGAFGTPVAGMLKQLRRVCSRQL